MAASSDAQARSNDPPVEGVRYTHAASIENHPQITDFIPRRFRTYSMLTLLGGAATTGIVMLHLRAAEVAAAIGSGPMPAADMTQSSGLAAWFGSAVLLVTSVVAMLVFSLRRHRVNDYRARYRVWLGLTLVCLLLSINATAVLHGPWCRAMAHLTGWTFLAGGAVWWLAPASLVFAWIGFRMMRDVMESRVALPAFLLAAACYIAATLTHFGWLPLELGNRSAVAVVAVTITGHLLLLLSITGYARYVVLDVQGLIEHKNLHVAAGQSRRGRKKAQPTRAKATSEITKARRSDLSPKRGRLETRRESSSRRGHKAEESTEWVDGSRPEEDAYDESKPRRLSKSERKRLRKLKARQQAA